MAPDEMRNLGMRVLWGVKRQSADLRVGFIDEDVKTAGKSADDGAEKKG